MKKTALNRMHHELGAKMVPFAGFEMPVSYSGITEEHESVRNNAGIFDVSHMGQFVVTGKEAADLVQYITSNNSKKLKPGQAQYSCLPNHEGGIVDDLIVYRMPDADEERRYLLVVNASNIQKDFDWIAENNKFEAEVKDYSDAYSLIAIQGPKAKQWLAEITDENLEEIPFYSYVIGKVGSADNTIISNTGYTGSGGFELYVSNDQAEALWSDLMEHADKYNAKPCGLGARDTLRLEMGYCLYGNDLNDETSPIEAGLSWIVKTKIKSDFISKEIYKTQKLEGVSKKLTGFIVDSRRVPRKDYIILSKDGATELGYVTSGTMSPGLSKPIGMGYIDSEYLKENDEVLIQIGKKNYVAQVTRPPFIKQ